MTKITPFQPHIVDNSKLQTSRSNQYIPDYPADSFEFLDKEIEDKPSFSDKFKSFLGKNNSDTYENLEATSQMQYDASTLQFEAMRTKREVSKLISIANGDFTSDLINHRKGIYISFEEDNLGRKVMVEHDQQGNIKRATTFYEDNEEIQSIETFGAKKSSTKIIFFNYRDNYFEVRKESSLSCLGNYTQEVYSYRYNKPESYTLKNCNIFKSDVKKQTYTF